MRAARHGDPPFAPGDRDCIVHMRDVEKRRWVAIAKVLGRSSWRSVRHHYLTARPGGARPERLIVRRDTSSTVTDRLCLCCRGVFRSEGAHNRLCVTCRVRDVSPYEPVGYVSCAALDPTDLQLAADQSLRRGLLGSRVASEVNAPLCSTPASDATQARRQDDALRRRQGAVA